MQSNNPIYMKPDGVIIFAWGLNYNVRITGGNLLKQDFQSRMTQARHNVILLNISYAIQIYATFLDLVFAILFPFCTLNSCRILLSYSLKTRYR